MAMTGAVKKAVEDAFPHCNIGITEVNANSRTAIFQCISRPFGSQLTLQNIHLDLYTKKNFNRHPVSGRVMLIWHREMVLRKCIDA